MPKSIRFTGWESDRFVRFASRSLESGVRPHVQIIGREPITSTPMDLYATVERTIWDGYRRILEIRTQNNVLYQIGGSNATRPLAADEVIFRGNFNETFNLLEDNPQTVVANVFRTASERGARDLYTLGLRIRHGGYYGSEELASLVDAICSEEWPADSTIRVSIAELLGIIELPQVIEPLVSLLQDESSTVRVEASLRFRGLEPLIKRLGEGSREGGMAIEALTAALSDADEQVRIYAAEDLGYFYNQAAVKKLKEKLADLEEADHVRWATAIALGRTNVRDVGIHLLAALKRDTATPVKQAALLGLGRAGRNIRELLDPDELVETLLEHATNSALGVQDYAAYCLGELDVIRPETIQVLTNLLEPTKDVALRSNAALAATKALRNISGANDVTGRIAKYLEAALDVDRPTAWPGSAFHEWYLAAAGELAALLDSHGLAARYFQAASLAFAGDSWFATYYRAIAAYEDAERLAAEGELPMALDRLDSAITGLEDVRSTRGFRERASQTESGLEFRLLLARARRDLLRAAGLWKLTPRVEEDFREVEYLFREALTSYRRVDIIGLQRGAKSLSRQESNLVLSLQALAQLGIDLLDLQQRMTELNEARLRLVFGKIRGDVQALVRLAEESRSPSLRETARQLRALSERTYKDNTEQLPITETIQRFTHDARLLFESSLPTPGNCPIIDFGEAAVSHVEMPEAIAGDGSPEEPFLFPSGRRMVLQFTVAVAARSKNDRLIFSAVEAPAGSRDTQQEIQVHDSLYTLRPVDLGEAPAPSAMPIVFEFGLHFRNQGCGHQVDATHVRIRVFNPDEEFATDRAKLDKAIEGLEHRIQKLTVDVEDREQAAVKFQGETGATRMRRELRDLRTALNAKRVELAKLKGKRAML